MKVLPEEKGLWEQLAILFGEEEDPDDMKLTTKMRLAWKYFTGAKMNRPTILPRVERELMHLSQSSGLQARMPFVLIAE